MEKTRSNCSDSFISRIAAGFLKILGWQIMGVFPDYTKYVLVGAPHTSNWDFPVAMLWMIACGKRFNWIGKDSLFTSPLGPIYRRLGGVPVRRDSSYNFVDQIVDEFNRSERLIIAITPEGTRSKTPYWKSGFYFMALGAQVPIVLGFIDFGNKQIGIGPTIQPSGNIQEDFIHLREFYGTIKGLYPDKQGAIILRPETDEAETPLEPGIEPVQPK